MERVRLDKWPWACRFFKTRSLAKQAIEGGRVQVQGQRVKAGKELIGGELVTFRRGYDQWTVEVIELQDTRRSAPEVASWYAETPDSQEARKLREAERRLAQDLSGPPPGRPTKKQRRQIHRFQRSS